MTKKADVPLPSRDELEYKTFQYRGKKGKDAQKLIEAVVNITKENLRNMNSIGLIKEPNHHVFYLQRKSDQRVFCACIAKDMISTEDSQLRVFKVCTFVTAVDFQGQDYGT